MTKKRLQRRKRRPLNKKAIVIIIAGVILSIVLFLVLKLTGVLGGTSENAIDDETAALVDGLVEDIPQDIPENASIGKGIVTHIVTAGKKVEEAYAERPPMIALTDDNKRSFLNVDCKIDGSGKVSVTYTSEGLPKSDDKFYYLFDIDCFDDTWDLTDKEPVARGYKTEEGTMTCDLRNNTSDSRLFKKFGVAVKLEDSYELVGFPSFITNPEVLASHKNVFMEPKSKKGILIDYNRVFSGQLEDLGIAQAAINIPVASIMGPTTNPLYPSIQYSYNGRNYTFNGVVIAGFDSTVSALTQKGIQTTAIVLNDYNSAYISMIHPDARSRGVCPYYMFNGATADGVETLAAVGAFLADRYSGDKHGRISNWVIANEINARKEWNYLKYTDVDTYTREYAKGFRVLYTAIKSISSSARVMISLDQTWDKNVANSPDYDGKDVLDAFNAYLMAYGNIDWSLAYHPYNFPLTSCKTWASSPNIVHNSSTATISMQNIEVLVDYLNQEHYLNPDGDCRSIMITELGYTSTQGEELQAAAIAYAYYKIENYKDIDGLLLNRQTDDATEIAQNLATGITTAAGLKKASYNVYKYAATDEWKTYFDPYLSVIGVGDWKNIMYSTR